MTIKHIIISRPDNIPKVDKADVRKPKKVFESRYSNNDRLDYIFNRLAPKLVETLFGMQQYEPLEVEVEGKILVLKIKKAPKKGGK